MKVLNPVASQDTREFPLAARASSLDGVTLGLAWNGKPGGEIALERIAQKIQERHSDVKVLKLYDDIPFGRETIDKCIAKADVVVGSTGD
jgi:hypothetical protein